MTDLLLRAGRLPDGRLVDLGVRGGEISDVSDTGSGPALEGDVTDLDGQLLVPPLGEPHAHLDKALTAERIPNPTGDLPGAVDAWEEAMTRGWFGHSDVVARASAALDRLILSGVTAVRTHVNVSERVGATGVRALREVAVAYRDLVDVQIVALATSPLTGPEGAGNRSALHEALAAGADLVGGAPQFDPRPDELIDYALDVARFNGVGIDLHMDETLDPAVLSLRYLARRVFETGFEGPVTASHCVSLSVQDESTRTEIARQVAEAGISVVALPHTNLFLQGRDHPRSMPRGLTAVGDLLDAGVVVAAGADNVEDPYNPVGRSDPLETAALMIMTTHRLPGDAFDLVSGSVRALLGLRPVRFEPGDPADFLVAPASSVRELIARAPATRHVYRGGRLVASSTGFGRIDGRSLADL
jgi:cytosine deaminase